MSEVQRWILEHVAAHGPVDGRYLLESADHTMPPSELHAAIDHLVAAGLLSGRPIVVAETGGHTDHWVSLTITDQGRAVG